jgi:cytochrome P450
MLHDPETYPDPFTFDPERYTTKGQRDPRNVCFGYGRRICPGMYLAEASLFSTVSMSLSVFNIEKALDDQGIPITPVHENTTGTIRSDTSFFFDLLLIYISS